MRITLLLLFVSTSFLGISQELKMNDQLIGTWIIDFYDDPYHLFKKVKSFKDDEGGIQFKSDGTIVKRQNAGWCGTPPITYANFDGAWEMKSDSTVIITSNYWGGEMLYQFEIAEISDKSMKFIYTQLDSKEISESDEVLVLPDDEFEEEEVYDEPEVYTYTEQMPRFGTATSEEESTVLLMQYFGKKAKEIELEKEGKVYLSFVVSKTGEIVDVEILRSFDTELGREAKKWVKEMPRWQPGIQSDRPVAVKMIIPVRFEITD